MNNFESLLAQSSEIVTTAVQDYKPYAIVLMLSGGDDSLLAFEVCKRIGVKLDYVIHGNTRTGLPATSEFVRQLVSKSGIPYLEADAGTAYRDYVLRKGFFGKGKDAHQFSYHVLKATPFRKTVSKHIRKRKRNRRILLINGVRLAESQNRADNMQDKIYNPDPAAKNNIWVNVVHYWSNEDKDAFLLENCIERNPVAVALGRSGECMCGTTQGAFDYIAAKRFDPAWGAEMDALNAEAKAIHGFGWGEKCPKKKKVQVNEFQPMCVGCKALDPHV